MSEVGLLRSEKVRSRTSDISKINLDNDLESEFDREDDKNIENDDKNI